MSSWGIKKDPDNTLEGAVRIPNWDYRKVLQSAYHAIGLGVFVFVLIRGIPISTDSLVSIFMGEKMKSFLVSIAKEAMTPPAQEESALLPQVDKPRPIKKTSRLKRVPPKVIVPKSPLEEGIIVDRPVQPVSSVRVVSLEMRRDL